VVAIPESINFKREGVWHVRPDYTPIPWICQFADLALPGGMVLFNLRTCDALLVVEGNMEVSLRLPISMQVVLPAMSVDIRPPRRWKQKLEKYLALLARREDGLRLWVWTKKPVASIVHLDDGVP
jgi:hypothetical protein